jgi:Protein of unknown function (DUF2490)
MKLPVLFLITILFSPILLSQTKQTETFRQTWMEIFSQNRFSNKWGLWTEVQVSTRDNFTNKFNQSVARVGAIYYFNETCKAILGYANAQHFPGDSHQHITQPENRIWEQFQWQTRYPKSRLVQSFRLEERFPKKILNDSTLGDGYSFNYGLRYYIWYDISLSRKGIKPHTWSVVTNEELYVNFGKQVVYNYFDQNRFFLGFKYQFGADNNIQTGYMNIFQQLSGGNKYKDIHSIRVYYIHNLDWRKKTNNS